MHVVIAKQNEKNASICDSWPDPVELVCRWNTVTKVPLSPLQRSFLGGESTHSSMLVLTEMPVVQVKGNGREGWNGMGREATGAGVEQSWRG